MVYDVVVVGGGHAGYEAAHAAARLCRNVALVTMDISKIGALSCNPAVGGTAKGHLVKEIDALGGIMGLATDLAGIQFRILNRSRGPAVWSPRAQVDRHGYPEVVQQILKSKEGLEIISANVVHVEIKQNRVSALIFSDGSRIECLTAVLTCGTFLNGKIHIGLECHQAGRIGEPYASGVTESLRAAGFESGRLKTGTPPRVHKNSICFDGLEKQDGDVPPEPFSWKTESIKNPQVSCHLTYTNESTHDILRGGFEQSPMYTGRIKGVGPRYCPSIEDKINRFADKTRHQIFLEPEGHNNPEYYVNGFSTSLPAEVQDRALRTVPGLENVRVLRPGYAVEYDFFPPYQINKNMETKAVEGLFFAGQINGTSGYEEAGAQGLMAGINAALKVRGEPPFILQRNEAYIGVLIDDLVNKSTLEPYRIFTSLAEHRLLLRYDNADLRLTPKAESRGLISHDQMHRLELKLKMSRELRLLVDQVNVRPDDINSALSDLGTSAITEPLALINILRRPGVPLSSLLPFLGEKANTGTDERLWNEVIREVDVSAKYEGYIAKQYEMVDKFLRLENKTIPRSFDFASIKTLSKEAKEKLSKVRPDNVGQASRVSGVTPADISILLVYLERGRST